MLPDLGDPKEMALYLQIVGVGLEMVVPAGIGMVVDSYWHCTPWGVAVGFVLGFAVGLVHLVHLANREVPGKPKPPANPPEESPRQEPPAP